MNTRFFVGFAPVFIYYWHVCMMWDRHAHVTADVLRTENTGGNCFSPSTS